MPELPEVETIVRDLRRLVQGSTIERAHVLRPDLVEGPPEAFATSLAGRRMEEITRRAKNIVADLGGDRLIINLGMTGRVLVREAGDPEPRHVGVRFALADGRRMIYQDVRRFGRLSVMPEADWSDRSSAMGVEPLSPEFTPELLHRLSRMSRSPIKSWLMDQHRVVGVGNIYASEALFRAGISPRRSARRLTRRETAALHESIRSVLGEAIEFRGTTLLDYRDASGERGEFSRRLRVYDREGDPCVVCDQPIRRIVQAGRSTFFCSRCQR